MNTYPEALLGYRAWFLRGSLFSMGLGAEKWDGVNKKAVCKKGKKHLAPDNNCMCGIHAFYDFADIISHRQGLILDFGWEGEKSATDLFSAEKESFSDFAPYILVGSLMARGRVELHWNGFRAEEVKITSLLVNRKQAGDPLLQELGVPLFQSFRDFQNYSQNVAGKYPKSARPAPPLSAEKMRRFPEMFSALRDETEYRDLAKSLGIKSYEMGDLALSMGLPLPRW